jgi:N-acetylglucosaminyldiphosphoundecaprenol N-acetyl-beta-D-mannosaminyltransferase
MEDSDLSVPDSVPFLWFGRLKGFRLQKRCGIEEVMLSLFELSNQGLDYKHYFYGNTQKVLDELKRRLVQQYPKLNIVGMYSPPFRELTPGEEEEHIRAINESNADFLWVSLGCPKQELWLYDHREQLNVVLGGGAGAVFNFLSDQTPKAPKWIRYIGMEWLMRLLMNPKRLWRRYLVKYPKFLFCVVTTKLKRILS